MNKAFHQDKRTITPEYDRCAAIIVSLVSVRTCFDFVFHCCQPGNMQVRDCLKRVI